MDVGHAPWGRELLSRTDYILVIDRCLIQKVAVWDARNNTYHYPVLGFLHIVAHIVHLGYLRKQKHFPLKPLKIP